MHPPVRLLLLAGLALHAGGAPVAAARARATPTVTRLETNAAPEPLGIDDRAPRLSWAIESARRGVRQATYRVLVASRPELLREGRGDIWDSGVRRSDEPWAPYGGPPLRSRTRYHWSVRLTTADGLASGWAAPAWFETGLLDATDWRGHWIAGPERGGVLTPAEGAADDSAVRAAGEFCRPVRWLTSGFAAARVRNNQGECREVRPAPMLRASFRVTKPVARARVFSSGLAYNDLRLNGTPTSASVLDPAFTNYARTVLYAAHDVTPLLRQGENVIATELGSGQFDNEARSWDWGWERAEWRATPRLRLDLYITYADGSEQVVASDSSWRVSVAGPTRYDNYYLGETYDARREVAGWDRPGFDASGPAWSAARVVSPPQGVARAQTLEPIRVVERVHQVRSALPRTSSFASGNATLDRIHRNTAWAIQNNFHGVITDTPVYEKNAWTGDAQLTAGAASTLFDTERLYGKLFQDMRDNQSAHGEVTLLAPTNQHYGSAGKPAFKPAACCGATPAWDAFWFVIPWESYLRHGDLRALAGTYPAMRLYLESWLPQWTRRDGDDYAHTLTAGLGDWVPPQGVPTVNAISSTAYYAHFARIAAGAARALGRPREAARYDTLFARVRADFNARFLAPDGVYRERAGDPFVQTAQILPLAFGLVPDTLRAAVARRLADDIVTRRGGNAWVGVLGARYVLPVLTETGHHDVAYTVATQTDEPSWGYWTDVAGFTALGEHWPASTRSRNHHMFGAIVQWLYEDLAGVRPLEPGYRRIEFRPEVPSSGLDSVSVSVETVRGTVAASWRRTPAGLELDVTVPPNATGEVHVPAPGPGAVAGAGGAGRRLRSERGRVIYEVGSGRHEFRVRGGGSAPPR